MADTVRLHRDPDYFPLMDGYKLVYHHTSTEFEETEVVEVEITDVRAFRDDAVATVVLLRRRMGEPARETFKVRKTARQVAAEGGVLRFSRVEFPLPVVPGKTWTEEPHVHEIAGDEAEMQVPAGRFSRCLRVNTRIGTEGTAIRYYAPGVGYIYEEYARGRAASRVSLVSFAVPPLRRS